MKSINAILIFVCCNAAAVTLLVGLSLYFYRATGVYKEETPSRQFKLPASAVSVPCPGDVDPIKVVDAAETSIIKQR